MSGVPNRKLFLYARGLKLLGRPHHEIIEELHLLNQEFTAPLDAAELELAARMASPAARAFDYHEYLLSPEWARRRDDALLAAGGRCQVCNAPDRLDVHHRTYERIGAESAHDLAVLCRDCHDVFHRYRKLGPK